MKAADIGYTVSLTLFFVFCGMSMLNSYSDRKLSELGTETIAPANLRRAAESFRLGLAVERHSKTIDDISDSDSWKELESDLSDYADRLELLREQRRSRNRLVMWMYLAAAISMAVFSFARRSTRSNEAQQDGDGQARSRGELIDLPDSAP